MGLRRVVASGALAGLVALAPGAGSVSAKPDCTYTFPPDGGVYRATVVDGDVICGEPGRDRVRRMEGGLFLGREGADRVLSLLGGTFVGGRGKDFVWHMTGGSFRGAEKTT